MHCMWVRPRPAAHLPGVSQLLEPPESSKPRKGCAGKAGAAAAGAWELPQWPGLHEEPAPLGPAPVYFCPSLPSAVGVILASLTMVQDLFLTMKSRACDEQ